MNQAPGKKPTVVHLGNVGHLRTASKTKKYAARFKGVQFVGIDLRKKNPKLRNWMQIRADFVSGLKILEDESVSVISSELALGDYTRKGKVQLGKGRETNDYTKDALALVHKKLKKGGKLMAVGDDFTMRTISGAIARLKEDSGIEWKEIKVVRVKATETKRTLWMRFIPWSPLYQLIATK